jgi:hypothetical protein
MSVQPATPDILVACVNILSKLVEGNPQQAFKELHVRDDGFSRESEVIKNREACAFYLKRFKFSLPEIASAVGYRSHSSAYYAISRHKEKILNGEANDIRELTSLNDNQQTEPYRVERGSRHSEIDRLCLEILASMNVADPERTLAHVRIRKNGRLNRSGHIARVRQELAFHLRETNGMTYGQIAATIGYLDHTTVIHAVNKHWERMEVFR